MLKVVSIQTVKSKLKGYVKAENHTNFTPQTNLSVSFGPDRGLGIDITKNIKFEF
jgi:hypothetical protein